MTKAEVILNAINSGATDEELVVLENTPEEQFTMEVEEKEETTAPEVKEDLTPEGTAVKEENTVSTGEESSTVTPEVEYTGGPIAGPPGGKTSIAPRLGEKIQSWAEGKKTKLDLAVQNANIETPLTAQEINNITTELELSQSPKIQELEARLKEVPSMSQEAADILKEIESIKSVTTEARFKPKNKKHQNNLNIIQEHSNKVMEITDRVLATGGDQEEVNRQIDFYEKNNPDQTRVNTADYEVETINNALEEISTAREGDDYSAFNMEGDEATELNELVEQQIIEDLSIKDMGRAAEKNYTLEEKENVILSAKEKVLNSEYEKAEEIFNSAAVLDFKSKEENLIQRIEQIADGVERDGDNNLLFKTQQEADAYNNLIEKYNALGVERESVNDILESAQVRLQDISAELGYNVISKVFANNFETTAEYEEWKDKHVKERGFWGGTYDAVGTLVQEGVNIAADATIGTGVWLGGLMDNKFNEDDKYYNGHDMVQDWYKNYAKYNWTGVSDAGADILDKDGNYTINARSTSKTIAEMLPFTIGVILSASKGNIKPVKSLWNTVGPKFLTSDKGRQTLRMMDASYRMTVNDNFHEGKDLGLDDSQAYAYSNIKSFGTGISQAIMPDINFLGGTAGKTILNGFVSNLKNATTKKAIGVATKNFTVNMVRELGEEELELVFGDIAKYSVGLAHSPDILDIRTQKETIAATLMLSGSLGSVGTVNDIKNAKKQVYEQYKNNGQDIIDVLDDNLRMAEGKLKRARTQKSKENHQATIDQINEAKNYGQSIINAINIAPENVSDDQIDLLIQKQNLVDQKQGKDKAISVGIDNQIKEIDEQISNSVIKQAEREQTAKIKTTVKEAIDKGDLKGATTEMTSEEILNIEGVSEQAAKEHGLIALNPDGSFNIILNKDKKMVATEAHEFGHAVLYKTIGSDQNVQDRLGDALIEHVANVEGDMSILGQRLSAYGKVVDGEFIRDDNFGEEVMTIMSESIIDGSLKLEESLFTKIGDGIRRFFQKIAPNTSLGRIKLDTGKDVFNFVKDYSKNITEGKINKAILNVAKEGAEGKLVEGKATPEATTQMSKDAKPKTPEQLVKTIQRGGNPKKVKEAQDKLAPQFELLALSPKALNYDTRTGDIAREDVAAEAMTYFDGIVERFTPINPKTGEKRNFSTFVIANMRPKRQVIYQKVKPLTYGETTSTDTKEARQIEDTSSETTNTEDTFVQKINILQDFAIANRVADKIKALVKVAKGDNFKSIISKYAGKVGALIFEIPAKKIMEGGANLAAVTKYTEGMPAPAEAQNIQRFFNAPNNADKFIKTLPLYNVTDKTADINKVGENLEVSRDTYGYAIGLKGLPLDYFYENYTDPKALSKDPKVYEQRVTSKAGRSMGLTSQTPMKRLKPQFRKPTPETVEQFKKDLGITPKNEANVYSRDIGQLLKGVAKVHSINAAISGAQRVQEAKLKTTPVTEQKAIKQQTADITAAQSKIAFSRAVKGYRDAKKLVSKDKLAPKQQVLLEREKGGKIIGEIINMRGMQSYQDIKNNITYEEFYTNQLLDFFESYPQYYDLMSGALTGGIKRAAFFDKAYFDKVIKKFAKKNNKQNVIKAVKKADQVGPKRLYYHSGSKFKGLKNLDLTIDDGKVDFLIKLFNDISKHTKKQGKEIFQEVLTHFGIDQNNFMRKSAPLIGYPVDKNGKEITNKKGVEEHAVQMEMARIMMGSAFDGNMKDGAKLLRATYSQISLLEVEDPGGQYKQSMGNDFYNNVVPRVLDGSLDFLPNGFVSIYRLMKAGVNPFGYKLIGPKQTIAEYFGVNNLNIEKAQQAIIDVFEGKQDINVLRAQSGIKYVKDIDGKYVFSKAINRSRTVNPAKGITVLDFDDTLATTKSGVRAKIPNPDGTPKPGRKVIFLAGGAGSGKGNVISKLGLEDQGFKVVNSDISLEWLKKNSGLPANMNDFTKEQRSKLGSLQHQARGIARRKQMKYQGEGNGVVVDGTGGSIKSMEKLVNGFKDKGYDVSMMFVETSLPVALERNAARKERSLLDKIVTKNHEAVQGNKDGFKTMFGDRFMEVNTDNLSQQDAMPTKLTEQMNDFVSGYENRRLDAEEFASEGADILDQGGTFDFSEFNKVVEGQTAPLFNKAMKLQGKFGNKDMFVLTARPAESAPAIFEFLQANGLNIPLENITGLANSTPESKALWMADKVADGYNDFYFADDALQNVQAVKNMLDQFDVKSKVQQAKIQFSKTMNTEFNNILESTTGILSQKEFSDAQAKLRGRKTKYKSIIPASAQDFQGLLYNFLGKGKKGEADLAFFKKALMDPFARGIDELNGSRQSAANDFENLNKNFPEVKKILNKNIEGLDYTNDQAIRVYLWDKSGFQVPGLSKRDLAALTSVVQNNPEIQAYADAIGLISKKENGYSAPKDYWLAESVASDLLSDGAIGDARANFLAEWQQNVDQIFSKQNLNKIQAIYGNNFREALEDSLYRMRTGRNRPMGGGRLMNGYMNWVNNSVGAIMFFNMRSAILQTISATNYMNWSFNNPAKAAQAFANQPQYWKDFSMIFNSPYLKQRRSGNQRGINEAELSEAVAGSDNKAKAAIAWLLKKGFLPTQLADSFAIASGGASFYRNKVKALMKEGMTQEQAEAQAFLDFQEVTEVSQQSARPDMISQQQASPLGRLILSFQNTPMQYARIINKSARDLANGRGDTKTHMSKIAYYGVAQGIIFGALQSALFAALGDDEEEQYDKKKERIINQMIDSLLSGIGYGGKAISTAKNTIMEYSKQKSKKWNADHAYTLLTLLGFSPPIGSKLRKVYSSIQTEKFNEGVSEKRGLTLDNPSWSKWGNVIEGVTNVPLGRLAQKMLNIDNALDENNKWWERAALLLGWNTWDLGIRDKDIEAVKDEIKEEKKIESKKKADIKKEQKKKEKEKENKAVIEENKKKSKKDGICSAVSKGGERCKKKAINGGMCTIHENAEQNKTGEKSQCKHVKKSGKQCGMKTANKSGLCYYHD